MEERCLGPGMQVRLLLLGKRRRLGKLGVLRHLQLWQGLATVLVACCHGFFNGMNVWVLAGDLKVAMVVRVFVTGGGVGKFSEWRGVEVEVMTWKVTVWNRRLRISLIR